MVHGAIIDVPLIVGVFLLMFRFSKKLAIAVLRVKLPPLVLYLILSVPLIIFEEQIDCMPAWSAWSRYRQLFPFLFIEMLVLGGIALWRHAKNVLRVTLFYSIFGVLWEVFLGGLVGTPLTVIALLAPYVGVGYAFILMLPLTVLVEGGSNIESGKSRLPASLTTGDSMR